MILVTGATGKLGRHVIDGLLKKVPAQEIIAAVRDPQKAADLSARGVQVRQADYNRPETLTAAFKGVTRVLLISSSENGQRVAQHRAVVEAARAAGARLLAYTSILHAEGSRLLLAREHQTTEKLIRDSGLPFVFLRNGWYFENYTENLAPALAHGAILGSSGEGRVAAASREDYAAAAVEVLTGTGHDNRVYELAGDTSFSLSELASEVSRQVGRPIVYKDLPEAQYRGVLEQAGVPGVLANLLADSSLRLGQGELNDGSRDLSRLIGRPTGRLADAVTAAVKR
jgi:NAD(P)H dehydrogenase (quinone)